MNRVIKARSRQLETKIDALNQLLERALESAREVLSKAEDLTDLIGDLDESSEDGSSGGGS